jgi:lipopolysaccharide cholinephosphotransferase
MEEDFSKYNGEGTILRKAQLRMLEILIEVDKICRKHNISYLLEAGTLLGAVRHSGFIPWDDDVDIGIMRKDYKRLCRILKKELPHHLVFQDATTEKYYPCSFAKVRDKYSILRDNEHPKTKEKGIYIDIFPFDKGDFRVKHIVDFFYNNIFMRMRHHIKTNVFLYLLSFVLWYPICFITFLVKLFSNLLLSDNYIFGYGAPYYYHNTKKKDLLPVKPVLFEGREFFAPAHPEVYLTAHYGDYMKIPEESKRMSHSVEIIFLPNQ